VSRREPKAGEWLRQQIEELGALRNASVRDPQFKAWRQNTLTFIQRIWEGDTTKSERFRRIPFSPASTRADARAIREQFERGCGEALEYLNTLLDSLGEERVAPGTTRAVPRDPERIEGDFPVVELGAALGPGAAAGDDSAPEVSEGVIGDGPLLDLPDADAPAPQRSSGPSRLPSAAIRPVTPEGLPEGFAGATPLDSPAPPAQDAPPPPGLVSRISVRGTPPPASAPRPPQVNPLKDILAPQRREAAAQGRSAKNGKKRKGTKSRLKDMLGFTNLEASAAQAAPPLAAAPAAPPPAPAPAAPPAPEPMPPVAEVVEAPPASAPGRDLPPAEDPVAAKWTLPEFMAPTESPLPLTELDIEPAPPVQPDAFEPPAEWTESEAASAQPVDDALDTARAMEDFLLNSPVMRAKPRPVQRRGAATAPGNVQPLPSRESAASRMLAIAAEVESLGVPEGQRARVRAALMDLARQLDEPELSWDVLRDAVQLVMEFPAIARRALPLLLPFLDLAA